MFDVCFLILGLICAVLCAYLILELNYFLRTCLCILVARFLKKKVHILDETAITGLCISTDIDYFLDHMNNARFLRELDFAKIDFFERTAFFRELKSHGASTFVSATTIRYRRWIKIFSKYKITTKIVYWDEQSVYLEHRFVTIRENFVNAIALCKMRLVEANADSVMADLMSKPPKNTSDPEKFKQQCKPDLPDELAKWIESNQISSNKLQEELKSSDPAKST
ncbi:protein THEM6 [Cylas formicarius]|uniref:protein THEM6 n=1 Tax=Cylas formicarius TaxID=197179 RepID=UPI002958B9B4|nr:protein THEM6 [Cylas formicarius]